MIHDRLIHPTQYDIVDLECVDSLFGKLRGHVDLQAARTVVTRFDVSSSTSIGKNRKIRNTRLQLVSCRISF